jgi:hypothetical protein
VNNDNAPVPEKTVLGVHRGIFMPGLISFLTDLSSEVIFSVFPIFLTWPQLRVRFRRDHLRISLRVLHFPQNEAFTQTIAARQHSASTPNFLLFNP